MKPRKERKRKKGKKKRKVTLGPNLALEIRIKIWKEPDPCIVIHAKVSTLSLISSLIPHRNKGGRKKKRKGGEKGEEYNCSCSNVQKS